MFKLQHKLSLGFGGLLLIILIIGGQSILTLTRLGSSIDVILRENYRSVVACQTMKESLERMDSGLLFVLLGEGRRGADLIRTNEMIFADALQAELNNITLPDEGPKARELRDLFVRYRENLDGVLGASVVAGQARRRGARRGQTDPGPRLRRIGRRLGDDHAPRAPGAELGRPGAAL